MTPQDLKNTISSGLLSFPLTDFDAKGDFNARSYAQRLEWLARAVQDALRTMERDGRPDNSLGCVQGRGGEIDRLTGVLCELIAARDELASEIRYAEDREIEVAERKAGWNPNP